MTLAQKLSEAQTQTQNWAKGENVIWPDCLEWTISKKIISKMSINEIYEGLIKIISCKTCKKRFDVPWSRDGAKFCSLKCYWKSMKKY